MRTAKMLLWGAAVTTGAAAIGAVTAAVLGERAEARYDRRYVALCKALITRPSYEAQEAAPDGQRPVLELIKGGLDG